MKSYPYIAINNHDIEFLVFSEKRAIVLNGVNKGDEHNPSYFIRRYKNITHEYLQNTYGEVVSPEHAEFIIELAENAGFDCGEFISGEDVYFYAGENSIDFTSFEPIASNDGKKQITIPLPPKADKQESSEWPQIGDDVFYKESGNSKGVVLAIDADIAWIKNSYGGYSIIDIKSLVKPKTPEEELRDDILDCDNFAITESKATQLANWLTNKGYEIKKRPR